MTGNSVRASAEADWLRRLFRLFADTQCRGRSAVYAALSHGVVADDDLLDLLARTPRDQRRPSLLFAAVNHLLAGCPDAELAAYYPIHGGHRPVDDRLVPAFAAFCAAHAAELDVLLRTRSTQTNEIRRCAALRLALTHVSQRWPGPFALAEIGASAGLNLLFDHYAYRVGDLDSAAPTAAAPVRISCELRGDPGADNLLRPVPEISGRLGIDQRPVQLTDPEQRAWLRAFVWPEDVADLALLNAAIDHALAVGPPAVLAGDATTDTARLVATLPGDGPIVVFTASLLSYLDAAATAAFRDQLQDVARARPVAWVFAENPGLVARTGLDLPALAGPLARRTGQYVIGASLRDGSDGSDGRADAILALADPYLRWLAPARDETDDFEWLGR